MNDILNQLYRPGGIVVLAAGLIFILSLVGLIILFWLNSIRRRRKKARQAAARPAQEPAAPAVEAGAAPPITEPSLAVDEQATVPSPPREEVYSPDLSGTQPGVPVHEAVPAETAPIAPVFEPATWPISGRRPANITWQIAGLTDVGMRRELNEDKFLMVEAEVPDDGPCGLYVVADGMGGHERGELASQLTIDAIGRHFGQHPPAPDYAPFEEWLKAAAMSANQAVLARQEDRTKEKKMGSTLVMALVARGQAHIANVGDSRAYLIRGDGIEQISVDHSLVERLIQIGQITREEARTHKQRNVIYNTIGDKPDFEVGLYHVDLQPGDRLLLCSDGLSGMVADEQILDISRSYALPAEACKVMVEAAKSAGGTDNITAIIIQMDGGEDS